MIRARTLAVILALCASPALAVVPRPGPGDPRIHRFKTADQTRGG